MEENCISKYIEKLNKKCLNKNKIGDFVPWTNSDIGNTSSEDRHYCYHGQWTTILCEECDFNLGNLHFRMDGGYKNIFEEFQTLKKKIGDLEEFYLDYKIITNLGNEITMLKKEIDELKLK